MQPKGWSIGLVCWHADMTPVAVAWRYGGGALSPDPARMLAAWLLDRPWLTADAETFAYVSDDGAQVNVTPKGKEGRNELPLR